MVWTGWRVNYERLMRRQTNKPAAYPRAYSRHQVIETRLNIRMLRRSLLSDVEFLPGEPNWGVRLSGLYASASAIH